MYEWLSGGLYVLIWIPFLNDLNTELIWISYEQTKQNRSWILLKNNQNLKIGAN